MLNRLLSNTDKEILGELIVHVTVLKYSAVKGETIFKLMWNFLKRHNLYIITADACWALSYLTDGPNDKIQAVVECGVIPKLVDLLASTEVTVLIPALRAVGNIATGNDMQTDAIISAGGLPQFGLLLQHHRINIVKEAAWTISNITAGNMDQIQHVINAGLLPPLIHVLQSVSKLHFSLNVII